MKASEFDKKFERDENIIKDVDVKKGKRLLREQRRVNVDIPEWMIQSLDNEAGRLGITRQSIIKVWLAERLEGRNHRKTG
jgi:predicted DNA binding CopG/RHH family protein